MFCIISRSYLASDGAIQLSCCCLQKHSPIQHFSLPNSWLVLTANHLYGHILRGYTCPVEPSHVHHGFMVGQLYILLGYHQLDLVPLLRLRDKKTYAANGVSVYPTKEEVSRQKCEKSEQVDLQYLATGVLQRPLVFQAAWSTLTRLLARRCLAWGMHQRDFFLRYNKMINYS